MTSAGMHRLALAGLAALALVFVAATADQERVERHVSSWEGIHRAVAVITPTEGSSTKGTVWLEDVAGGVRVRAEVVGLTPGAKHGFHIHEFGDGSALDASSAGGHFDPGRTGHHDRANAATPHHAGDLGNLEADAKGRATYDLVVKGITVAGLEAPVIGRGIIIHALPDDFGQPTGNAGARIGFGCIGIARPEAKSAP